MHMTASHEHAPMGDSHSHYYDMIKMMKTVNVPLGARIKLSGMMSKNNGD